MKTLYSKKLGLLTALILGAPLAAACAVAPSNDDAADTSQSEQAVAAPEAKTLCGVLQTPPARACNTAICQGDSWAWVRWPDTTPCTTSAGLASECLSGACSAPITGTLAPHYKVLSVAYAPPGSKTSVNKNTVSYGSGSTMETITSATSSFKSDVKVTVTSSLIVSGATGSNDYSFQTDGTDSIDTKKSTSFTTTVQGTATADGINHDYDLIYLWLNPLIQVTVVGEDAQWTFVPNGPMDIQYVSVGQLKGTLQMSPGLAYALSQSGITAADYPAILAYDPFASGSTALDATRFAETDQTIPYEAPQNAGDTSALSAYALNNQTMSSVGTTHTKNDAVGFTASVGTPSFIQWLATKLEVDGTWTWTDKTSLTTNTTSTQSATLSIYGPSYGYAGSTDLDVYVDNFYNTFLFVPIHVPPVATGTVVDSIGRAIAGVEVDMTAGGVTHRTFTSATGQYRFFNAPMGPAQVAVGGMTKAVTISSVAAVADFQTRPILHILAN